MIIEKIRRVYPQLTMSQKRLADFITTFYQEAAFMTASRLGRRVNVNEATVIRFAQRLGYPGYPELVRDVQALVQEELQTAGERESGATDAEPLLVALNGEVESLSRAVSHISPEAARRAVALLRGARRVWVAGQGVSYHLAGILAAGLAGLGLDARVVSGDAPSLALAIADLQAAEDAFVGVCASAESPDIAHALVAARERGARTLALAGSPISGAAQAADLALTCTAGELLPAPSVAGLVALADALVQALAGLDAAQARRFAQTVEEAGRRLRLA